MPKFLTSLFFSVFCLSLIAQTNASKWMQKTMGPVVFTENKGKFAPIFNEEILYYSQFSNHTFFFSKTGIIIGQQEILNCEEQHTRFEKIEKGIPIPPLKWNYIKITFDNANPSTSVHPKDLQHFTSHFQDPNQPDIMVKAKNYKELTYYNLYDKINLVFTLPDSGGLKYNFYINPGGNASEIKLTYQGANLELGSSGELIINSNFGSFNDMNPIAFAGQETVESEFSLIKNTMGFNIGDYDSSQTLVIDPWITAGTSLLAFIGDDFEFDIAYDDNGNCLILGEYGKRIALYNSSGELQWRWEYDGFGYGDIVAKPATSEFFYMAFGGVMRKFNLLGEITASFDFDYEGGDPQETWRLKYDDNFDQLFIGLGGIDTDEAHVSTISTDFDLLLSYEILTDPYNTAEDVALFETDPDDGSIYFLIANYQWDFDASLYGHRLYKVDPIDPTSIIWETSTIYNFREISNLATFGGVQGYNGIACGDNYLYTYDGNTLIKYDKTNGDSLSAIIIDEPPLHCAGIDTDSCGNVYIGTTDSILVFSDMLDYLEGYELPDTCLDLLINRSSIYVSGVGFVAEYEIPEELCSSTEFEDETDDPVIPEEDEVINPPIPSTEENPFIIAPNIFTPGNDGANDVFTFEFRAHDIVKFQCVIVNRWGVIVAQLDDLSDSWDGKSMNGVDCTDGTYFYTFKAESAQGKIINGQGNVQLVRE